MGFQPNLRLLDQYRRRHDEAVGSSIEGKEVAIRAGQDLTVRGSNVVSDGLTVLKAGNDVNITAAENTYTDHELHERKRSGLTGGFKDGVLSIGVGKSSQKLNQDDASTSLTVSQVGSISGDTAVIAGGRLNTAAAAVSAGNDVLLQGREVTLGADDEYGLLNMQSESKRSGAALSVNLKAAEVRQMEKFAAGAQNAAGESSVPNRVRAWEQGHLAASVEPLMPAVGLDITRSRSHVSETRHTVTPKGTTVNAGGNVAVKAAEGDVNIIGSQVYGAQNTWIDAWRDVNIIEAGQSNEGTLHSRSKTSGLTGSGAFGQFVGSKTDTAAENSGHTAGVGSVVGSGSGHTHIAAGRNYSQRGSELLADGNIGIAAQNILIDASEGRYHTDYYRRYTQKGITAGISSPLTQAVEAVQTASQSLAQTGKSGNSRTNAMAAANTGWQAYQAAQSISKAADGNGAGINVNITYGEQRNQSASHIRGTQSGGSAVAAGGSVTLTASGADITVRGSDVAGQGGTLLAAENNVNLLAAEQHHSERSSNSQRGWNAGVALDLSNGVSLGVTAGGNYGKGYGNGDEQTHRHTRVGDLNSQTLIQSGGDTTLRGAQVYGKGINLEADNLRIESVQDSAVYNSRQFQGSAQITVGYGVSGSADYSQSKTNADHRSVTEQSGIYAGDGGFQVNISKHTDLKGGIITATAEAENQGRNRFQTATLSHSDIQNHSRYEGESFGIGLSGHANGGWDGKQQDGLNQGIGYGSDGDNRNSVTKSGIGTRNIVIGNDTDGTQAAAVYTDTRTETAEQNSGRLNNAFDKERVQNEIDLQRNVSQVFSRNAKEVKSELNRHIADLDARKEAGFISNEEYEKQLAKYDTLKLLTDTVSMGLATPSDSLSGSLLAAASPAVSREIGDYFKKLNPETGKDRQGTPAHLAAHMVWNAAVAYATGNNTATAALSAGSSEAAAPVISNWLFNQNDPAKLNEEQKATLANITGLLGSGIGAVTGDYRHIVSDGFIGQTVTEQNSAVQAGRGIAIPLFGALYCALDKGCESVTDTFVGMMAEQRKKAQEEQDALFAPIQNTQKGDKKAQPKPLQQGSQAATGAPMPPDDEDDENLSSSQKREIRSLNKRIKEHKDKIDEFKKNPTVRPGMENLPKDVIKAAQERRILHLEREIKAFQTRIDFLKGKAK